MNSKRLKIFAIGFAILFLSTQAFAGEGAKRDSDAGTAARDKIRYDSDPGLSGNPERDMKIDLRTYYQRPEDGCSINPKQTK
ncbi:exported hypothetical protein [Syntrophobacter sp. SbD1]|nr:exported hypothetical protein [Syntrophobacter sp. SbD1]